MNKHHLVCGKKSVKSFLVTFYAFMHLFMKAAKSRVICIAFSLLFRGGVSE